MEACQAPGDLDLKAGLRFSSDGFTERKGAFEFDSIIFELGR